MNLYLFFFPTVITVVSPTIIVIIHRIADDSPTIIVIIVIIHRIAVVSATVLAIKNSFWNLSPEGNQRRCRHNMNSEPRR